MPIKKVLKWRGLSIGIEFEPGDIRFANTDHPKTMTVAYGHIRGFVGADGEALDCYIGPSLDSEKIFQLHQLTIDGEQDEDKYFFGFNDIDEARKAYLANMPKEFLGGIVETTLDRIETFRRTQATEDFAYEVTATESIDGLPTVVKVRGPANKLSFNGRNWIDQRIGPQGIEGIVAGAAKTVELIRKGEQLKVRYSHPKDDPEITGKLSAGHLLDMGLDPATKEFFAVIALHHKSEDGLEVARRIAAGDRPDFSFRARVNCEDQETLTGDCVPKPGMPLLIDFLRPYELPGIPGSQVSQVLEHLECKKKSDCVCHSCKTIKDPSLATEALNKPINNLAGVPNISGGKTKGDKRMSMMKVLQKIAAEPDENKRAAMAEVAGMLGDNDADDMPETGDPDNPDMPEQMAGETDDAYEARMAAAKAKKDIGTESVRRTTTTPKPTVKTNPKPQPQARAKAERISDEEAAESMGMSVDEYKFMRANNAAKFNRQQLATQLSSALESAYKPTGDGLLFGYPIRDQKEKFPDTAVESYIKAAGEKCEDFPDAKGFIKANLELLFTGKAVTATESLETSNPGLKGSMQFGSIRVGRDNSAYKPDKTALEEVDKIEAAMLDYYKEYEPEKYAKYEANKGRFKLAHDQARDQAIEQYGPRIRAYQKPSTAMEDINPVDAAAVPNFAKVMTAVMGIRYWIPSPMREFFGVLPAEAMRLGPMLDNGDGEVGQFVEVMTEIRDQREIYDAAYFQLPTDIQREIGYRHGYSQYFAFQESTRFRTDSDVEFFMGAPPLGTSVTTIFDCRVDSGL